MVCHGELVRLRPDPRRLTEFYLMISAGGALGGIFVSLVAPSFFPTFFEWKIGLGGSATAWLVGDDAAAGEASGRVGSGARHFVGPGRLAAGTGRWACIAKWIWQPRWSEWRNFYGVVSVEQFNRDDPEKH